MATHPDAEDTEWNDILRAHGILPQKPKIEDSDIGGFTSERERVAEGREQLLADTAFDELDELDEFADDHAVQAYRQQRLAELQALAAKARFGSLRQISAVDFIKEVTETSRDAWVVVHMFQDSLPMCRLLNERLGQLATKHPATKFVKIISTDCIRGYPDRNLPTLLVYGQGDMRQQLVGTAQLGGPQFPIQALERILVHSGAIEQTSLSDGTATQEDETEKSPDNSTDDDSDFA